MGRWSAQISLQNAGPNQGLPTTIFIMICIGITIGYFKQARGMAEFLSGASKPFTPRRRFLGVYLAGLGNAVLQVSKETCEYEQTAFRGSILWTIKNRRSAKGVGLYREVS
jgi:hypothetical protein